MKKLNIILMLLVLTSIVSATTLIRNVDMRRDDGYWAGRIYEASKVDNKLKLYLLGKRLDQNACGSRWDLVLEDDTGEIYRDVGKVSPSRIYYYYGQVYGGTWTSTLYVNLAAGSYNDVTVIYDCPNNDFWDVKAQETFDLTIDETAPSPPPTYRWCSWWARRRGYC